MSCKHPSNGCGSTAHHDVDLIDNRQWMFQARGTSLPKGRRSSGGSTPSEKMRKGTGIRAPRCGVEAAHKMTGMLGRIRSWVMTLSRVVENFDPASRASMSSLSMKPARANVMALVALYLGHNVVVVGDHEQVRFRPR